MPSRSGTWTTWSPQPEQFARSSTNPPWSLAGRADKLVPMSDGRLNVDRILEGLSLTRVGRRGGSPSSVEIVDTTSSTNDYALSRAEAADADGFVVFAERQTEGRGRLGRRWESPRGASLLCSVLLTRNDEEAKGGAPGPFGSQLALVAAVAAHDAVADTTGVQVEIKWPNDLLADGHKVGGVLVETRSLPDDPAHPSAVRTAWVIGIGINCLQQRGHFSPELRDRATSLDLVATRAVDRNALARSLLVHLDSWLLASDGPNSEAVRRAWLSRSAPLGTRIKLKHAGCTYCGHVIDLDPAASLLVHLDSGERRLFEAATTTVLND